MLLELINRGNQRSVRTKKQILASLLIKGCNMAIGLLLVPLTIGYVNEEQYGIWLTLSSVVGWFTFFDFGLGNGLRNRLAEAMANGNKDLGRIYVSSAYAIITMISLAMLALFLAINPLLNWSRILNASPSLTQDLSLLAIIVVSFFSTTFVLKLVYMIFTADQQPSLSGFYNLVANLLSLLLIVVLIRTTTGSLVYLGIAVGLSPVLVLLFANIFSFSKNYQAYRPGLKYVRPGHFKELASLGIQFFIIQISATVMFSTDNMIITQILGPAAVTPYNIAYKYFGIATQVFSIICLPFWSAYTEAYVKKDTPWIQTTNRKLIKIWRLLLVGSLVLMLISRPFYQLWVPSVEVPVLLSILMMVYIIEVSWGGIYVTFLNGVSKVRLQLLLAVVSAALNIPLSILFAKTYGLGSAGVILATITCLFFGHLVSAVQYKKIITGKATGIWNR